MYFLVSFILVFSAPHRSADWGTFHCFLTMFIEGETLLITFFSYKIIILKEALVRDKSKTV